LKQEFEDAGVRTCDWKEMPHLLVAQINEKMMYAANNTKSPYLYVDNVWHSEKMNIQYHCGSGKKYISSIYAEYLEKSHQGVNQAQVRKRLEKLFYIRQERKRSKVMVLSPGINYAHPVVPNIHNSINQDKTRKEIK